MDHTLKIILNSEETLFIKKNYNLKNILYSEWIYIIEGTMLLVNIILNFEGTLY